QNEEGIIECEDERSSSEPEDNQEQTELCDLCQWDTCPSQDYSSADHDDEEASERVSLRLYAHFCFDLWQDEEGMIESEDERSSSEPEDNQEQV
ncbi:unnamed protein product, partial [Porites lobata]